MHYTKKQYTYTISQLSLYWPILLCLGSFISTQSMHDPAGHEPAQKTAEFEQDPLFLAAEALFPTAAVHTDHSASLFMQAAAIIESNDDQQASREQAIRRLWAAIYKGLAAKTVKRYISA